MLVCTVVLAAACATGACAVAEVDCTFAAVLVCTGAVATAAVLLVEAVATCALLTLATAVCAVVF